MKRHALAALLLGGTVALAGCGSTDTGQSTGPAGTSNVCKASVTKPGYSNDIKLSGGATSLSGAGSTFINPAMSVWTDAYKSANSVQVAYQSIGSGGGIAQIQAGTVDFGATDAFMTDSDIAKAKGPILQVPLVLAPVVVVYNLPNIKSGVQFDGETLGKIFAGKITKWNDQALQDLNKDKQLPDQAIGVVHRSDGSGTTDIFTDYLTKESPTWVSVLGGADKSRGKTVAWPVGTGGKGNEGVSGAVNSPSGVGGIGYVEFGYAVQQNLAYGNVKNKSGTFIEPCINTVTAATNGVSYPDDLRFDLTDGSDKDAYPITGTTWALIYQSQADKAKGVALLNFLSWDLSDGQDKLQDINYAPLGKDLRTKAVAQLKKVTSGGAPLAQ
ncbi:MAG: phosphate ABC transporter substrate-binding protein PstS [Candidatus Dormiibacterota bacterium]